MTGIGRDSGWTHRKKKTEDEANWQKKGWEECRFERQIGVRKIAWGTKTRDCRCLFPTEAYRIKRKSGDMGGGGGSRNNSQPKK